MKKYLAGFLTALLLVVGVHATNEIKATLMPQLKIQLEDKVIELRDANNKLITPIAINGSTYLPVRAVSQALDLFVDYDAKTQTVKLSRSKLTKKDYLEANELWKVDNFLKTKILSAQRLSSTDLKADADKEELIMIIYEVENIGDNGPADLGLQVSAEDEARIIKKGKEDKKVEHTAASLLLSHDELDSFVKKGQKKTLKTFYKIDEDTEVDSIRLNLQAYNSNLKEYTQTFVIPVTPFKKK